MAINNDKEKEKGLSDKYDAEKAVDLKTANPTLTNDEVAAAAVSGSAEDGKSHLAKVPGELANHPLDKVDVYANPVAVPPTTNMGTSSIADPNALSNTQNPSYPKHNVSNLNNTSNASNPGNAINPMNKTGGDGTLSPGRPMVEDSSNSLLGDIDSEIVVANASGDAEKAAQFHGLKVKIGELLHSISAYDHTIFSKVKDFFMQGNSANNSNAAVNSSVAANGNTGSSSVNAASTTDNSADSVTSTPSSKL